MGAKRIQVSVDNGSTYRTLPGSTGEFREEVATVNDTVFGQTFESNEVSIGMWEVSANGFFKGVVGYCAKIRQGSTPVSMTTEATTLVSGKTYQINNTAKRIIDYFSSLTVFDNGVDHTADVVSVDYLSGLVTFASGYTVTGAVTVTGHYVPTSVIASARSFDLTQSANAIDTTEYDVACSNGGWRTHLPGLRTVSMDLSGIYNVSNGAAAALRARNPVILEISPDNSSTTLFRGYFKRHNRGQSGEVGNLEEETQTFGLWVPDGALVVTPFSWYFGGATVLNRAVRDVLTAWQGEDILKVRYQNDPDVASSGHVGDAVVTEASLSGSFEGIHEFSFGFRGTGAPAAV